MIWSRQVDEIRSDRALVLYGAALALANVVTCIHWQYRTGVPQIIGLGTQPLCWPFWENCHAMLSTSVVNRILWAYLFVSVLSGACFLASRITAAYWTLLAINLLRTVVMVQDYRLRANQHYMLNWMVLAFLFVPGKRALLHHLLVSLYFWAGVLKLDSEWLSGTALYSQDRLWLPTALVPAACAYVVLLETTIVFGIYSRRRWVFYGTAAQLVVFHIFSWPIVGFWYPMLMFCLLAILPLSRELHQSAPVTLSWTWMPRARRALYAVVLGVFGALQMVPHAFPGDSAVTGEGRVFALHMFDALIVCEATMTDHLRDGSMRMRRLHEAERLPHRSRCDPIIYFDLAKNACRTLSPDVVDVDVSLRSRHSADLRYRQTIDIRNFCAANPSYDLLRHNAWILD